jgi:NAD(P)H-dependent flavin oxidoreductase YrpB (nitropropane dioxygenase family)
MGGVATPELAAAVADAGALGMVSMVLAPPDAVAVALDALRQLTAGAFGINFLMPFVDPEAVDAAASRARVVEFFYADPDAALIERAHKGGALAAWQVGSAIEARAAADTGCDFVIAQGTEAGGHIRGELGMLVLLDDVLEAVDVPVVAAGGIGTARAMAAALAAGAGAVRVGTRFVAAAESGAHPQYVDALIGARATDTVITTTFSVMWPDAPHRVLRSCVEAAEEFDGDIVGELAMGTQRIPLPRFAVPSPDTRTTGAILAMPLYAGESVGAVTRVQPAADIVRELTDGAERHLTAMA